MSNRGSIVDATLYIDPSESLIEYMQGLERQNGMPDSIRKYVKTESKTEEPDVKNVRLTVSDVEWLSKNLSKSDNEHHTVYLHQLLEKSRLVLPENETIERNRQLEERCVKLRKNQMNREYRAMTKNVDSVRVKHPEESIAYQGIFLIYMRMNMFGIYV